MKKMDSRSKQHLSARVRTRSKTSWEGGERQRESGEKGQTHRKPNTFAAGSTPLASPLPSAFRLGICHFANFIGRRRLNGVCENHYRRPTGGGMGERREERGGTENREQIAKPRESSPLALLANAMLALLCHCKCNATPFKIGWTMLDLSVVLMRASWQ